MTNDSYRLARLRLVRQGIAPEAAEKQLAAMMETGDSFEGLAQAERRDLEAQEVAEQERRAANTPEARIARAQADAEARAARANLAELAREQLAEQEGLSAEDVAALSADEALRAARFEEPAFRDMNVDEQNRFYEENPEAAAAEEARLMGNQLLDRWNGLDITERAAAAAHSGAESIAEVEAELGRRGRDFSPIAGHVAAEKAFQTAKEAD